MTYQNSNTARIGVYAVGSIVTQDLQWIFREQPIEDYGIDAHIEICFDGKPTGRLIAAQIKSGESWFSSKSQDGFIYTGSKRHLEYWTSHSLPVILILFNPIVKKAFWVPVETDRITVVEECWKITVPFISYFDLSAIEMLKLFALPDYRKRRELKEIIHKFSYQQTVSIGIGEFLDALNKTEYYLDLVFPFIDTAFFWVLKTLSCRIRIRLITNTLIIKELVPEILRYMDESPRFEVRMCNDLHAKYLIMDGKIIIYGSSNLTQNQWRQDYNKILATDDQIIIEEFSEQFHQLWFNSFLIDNVKHKYKIGD